MGFGKEELEHEFERNARTAEVRAGKSERTDPRTEPSEPDRAGEQPAEGSLSFASESCEELMKQSNQGQARAEQNRQRDAELSRQLISELKKQVEQLENSNELLQNAISAGIGSLRDEVRESTVQEVKKGVTGEYRGGTEGNKSS